MLLAASAVVLTAGTTAGARDLDRLVFGVDRPNRETGAVMRLRQTG